MYITPFLSVAICVDVALIAWQGERKVFSVAFSSPQLILVCIQCWVQLEFNQVEF